MEKRKLKKLELTKTNNISLLSNEGMHQIKGGGGYWDPELGWVLDEVTVYAEDLSSGSSSVGSITATEWGLIGMATTHGGAVGGSLGGGWGALVGGGLAGAAGIYAAYTN